MWGWSYRWFVGRLFWLLRISVGLWLFGLFLALSLLPISILGFRISGLWLTKWRLVLRRVKWLLHRRGLLILCLHSLVIAIKQRAFLTGRLCWRILHWIRIRRHRILRLVGLSIILIGWLVSWIRHRVWLRLWRCRWLLHLLVEPLGSYLIWWI